MMTGIRDFIYAYPLSVHPAQSITARNVDMTRMNILNAEFVARSCGEEVTSLVIVQWRLALRRQS